MIPRLISLALIASLTACEVVEPLGGGHIHTRCTVSQDGAVSTTHNCGVNQFALCELTSDAGNGEVFAVCCNSNETDEACARSAGFTSADSGVSNQ